MGCDIHIHAEIRIAGTWHYYGPVDCGRDYELFEKMAGVRGEESEAVAPLRGVPEDATFMTRFHETRWGDDAHSKSWLSADEVASVGEWHKARGFKFPHNRPWTGYLFGNYFESFTKYPSEYPASVETFRFVFWFDN